MSLRSLSKHFALTQVCEIHGHGSEVPYLSLTQVARRLPPSRAGKPVHVNTVTRWILVGARLRDGCRLRLTAVRLPGRWVVTPEALEEFLAALTADRSAEPGAGGVSGVPTLGPRPSSVRPAGSGRKAAERIESELDRIGIRS